jgi:hypothetical protein
MTTGLMGFSDKRHIIYSLVRVLGGLGKTVILTPNPQYLQLSEGMASEFDLHDVRLVVYTGDVEALDAEYELHSYEYVIYDVIDDVPFKLDIALIMDDRSLYVEALENRDLSEIPVLSLISSPKSEMLSKEKVVKLPPASLMEPQLQELFSTRVLKPVQTSTFNDGMTSIVAQITGLSRGTVAGRLKKGVITV